MAKEAYHGVRKGTSGYRGSRGAETKRTGMTPIGRKAPSMIPFNRVDPVVNAHGFGHKGKQIQGPLRCSGDPRAHKVGGY